VGWPSALKSAVATRRLPRAETDEILLTFDDGPHPEGTPAVLDVLRRFGARAIFFVVGSRIARAPHMLNAILEHGHVLGNHSFAHSLEEEPGVRQYVRDLRECQNVIERGTGVRPRVYRPPLGRLSVAGLVAPRVLGLRSVLWSVDSRDWRMRSASDRAALAHGLRSALSGPVLREIVLFHDERTLTAELLEDVLPDLVARGVNLRPDLRFLGFPRSHN
jgi:peptidoglycan/xylan/chitin deacetylase (PgdA/CDA1 family)